MNHIASSFALPSLHWLVASPEIVLLSLTVLVLLVDLFVAQNQRRLTFALTLVTLVIASLSVLRLWGIPDTTAFHGMYLHNSMTNLMKLFIYSISFLVIVFSRNYVAEKNIQQGEYYILALFSILGMSVLVSANSLLILFLGLELMSLPIYAMVAMQRDSAIASEAAMKYFVVGAMATGLILYGMSLIYGATGSLNITTIASQVAQTPMQPSLMLVFALVFLVTGLFFKLGAAPFHMWAPDVYEGAPASVTLFLSTAPKIAAFALVIRLLVDAMPTTLMQWQQLLILVALASMAWGNIVAIAQKNLRRMLAYSSVAHMGYMSLGLIAGTATGFSAALFYMLMYSLMVLVAFGIITLLSGEGQDIHNVDDLRGLNSRHPWLAFMMLITMFSMAGIPPMVGFFAKLGVLEALIQQDMTWLATLAILFAVIGSYYYLTVVKSMYFEEPLATKKLTISQDMQIAVSVSGLALIAFGLFPTALIHWCQQAFIS